jgi:hypothetical protein
MEVPKPRCVEPRRIPVRAAAPIYPMSLILRADTPHPALVELRRYLESRRVAVPDTEVWTPRWGRAAAP